MALNRPALDKTLPPPPKTNLRRCARSYSDFHDAAILVLQYKPPPTQPEDWVDEDSNITNLGFDRWYGVVEGEIHEAAHNEYKNYYQQLSSSESHLASLSSSISTALDLLLSLSGSFSDVEAQTDVFRKRCELLLAEEQSTVSLAHDIEENLQFYNHLEPIARRLNIPRAGNSVGSEAFSAMLARLDECIQYMNTHVSHIEAESYQSRYRLLLTRGLTLIRVHFVETLRDITHDVTKQVDAQHLNDMTLSALLFAKFRLGGIALREVAQEIRHRARDPQASESGAHTEYQSLMNELYTSYSVARGKFVFPLVWKQLSQISVAPNCSRDLVAFARSSIGYVRGLCLDEYELWHVWFDDDEGLYDFLESLCEPLYDQLRPRIIRETNLVKLCDLCTLLQTRYLHDQDDESETAITNQLDFSILVQPALEDTQTRLVFRTLATLQDGIENFKPKAQDLEPPLPKQVHVQARTVKRIKEYVIPKEEIFPPMTRTTSPEQVIEVVTGDLKSGFDSHEGLVLENCYPTLRKAIWLLSRIYRLVNSSVFDDLAHKIVHETTLSLHRASAELSARTRGLDAKLFLLKHLLLLKQHIVAFDIEYVTPEVSLDFSSLTNTFYELRDRGSLFDPRVLWQYVGGGLLPRVIENMLDAKAELDARLRTLINSFIADCTQKICGTMEDLVATNPGFNGPQEAAQNIRQAAEREVPILHSKLNEYLDDVQTKETLLAAVHDQVVHNYEAFYEQSMVRNRASGKIVSTENQKRDEALWDPDTVLEHVGEVFRVKGQVVTNLTRQYSRRTRSVSRNFSHDRSI